MAILTTTLCALCRGSQNLVCFPGGKPEWWQCPACGGAGARTMMQPATVHVRTTGARQWPQYIGATP